MGREDRDRRRSEAHDAKTEKFKKLQAGGDHVLLTRKELDALTALYPNVVSDVRRMPDGKFDVHFYKGKRPRGV